MIAAATNSVRVTQRPDEPEPVRPLIAAPSQQPHALTVARAMKRKPSYLRGAGSPITAAFEHSNAESELIASIRHQPHGDQLSRLTRPPNIVRTKHNAFVRSNLRLVLKSGLEARRGRWVWPTIVRIETHRGPAGQKASNE